MSRLGRSRVVNTENVLLTFAECIACASSDLRSAPRQDKDRVTVQGGLQGSEGNRFFEGENNVQDCIEMLEFACHGSSIAIILGKESVDFGCRGIGIRTVIERSYNRLQKVRVSFVRVFIVARVSPACHSPEPLGRFSVNLVYHRRSGAKSHGIRSQVGCSVGSTTEEAMKRPRRFR